MKTPIYDYLKKYDNENWLRCHMPGHKGRAIGDISAYGLDITEIKGADSLFEADGIILESERNMSTLYGTEATFYSAGGSTLCIQAMLAAMKYENRRVIAVRNVHRAFLNAAALLDLTVEWVLPRYTNGILSGVIDTAELEAHLRNGSNACVYLTSPDYTGRMADIRAIAELCHRYGAPLLVDNAHGAHLKFLPEDIHPITLGADICCDSAHKMLPAFTGAAMLHTSQRRYADVLRQHMSLFASTSPSYLIMASLDLCCDYIDSHIQRDTAENLDCIARFREHFGDRLSFTNGDPFHITINTADSELNGNELAELLREKRVECEYSDAGTLILLMSPMNTQADYIRLTEALEYALGNAKRYEPPFQPMPQKLPEVVMSIRDAVFAPSEELPIELAEGRICGAVKVPCPPAIPIAVSGERINRETINLFKRYEIETVNVILS